MKRYFFLFLSLTAFSTTLVAKEVITSDATFQKLGKIVESEACPKDFSQSVGDTITRLCGKAKAGEEVEAEGYLKDDSDQAPEITCRYDDEHFIVIFTGTPSDHESTLTVQIDEKGQVLKIVKDQLEVSGKSCQDLASRIDKGGRIPASADTELCFDYYPAPKLTASRDQVSCKTPAKKEKPTKEPVASGD